ncbi:MAG: lamin tail domain-containing protein [Patescibacteria group bacterium]|jgi:hypothetical protein
MKKLLFLLLLLTPLLATATEPTVLINEICWMGTEISSNDEWIELYNPTENEIDLTGWTLEATDGSPKINLTGIIPAAGYFLLERTDDETVPAVPADQIYTGALSNTSEWLKLYDTQNNLIDEIDASSGWPTGDNATKQTLERTANYNWQTSAAGGGTPKAKNSTATSETEEPPSDEPEVKPEPEETSSSPSSVPESGAKKGDIIFTEIFPNPIGPDTVGEFIEIKNVSVTNINLTDWQIRNAAKQIFTIPAWTMTPKSILVFYRPETKLALNNEKEQIKLYSKSGSIIDQIEYKAAPDGQSYQLSDGKWYWAQASGGQENIYQTSIIPKAIITGPKEAKVGEIITFDASDSFDPENRPLSFFWDFGDGRTDTGVLARQIYLGPENYEIKLKVSADQASSTEKFKIKITGEKKEEQKDNSGSATTTEVTTTPMTSLKDIPFIFISEFLPNPQGSDDQEFIEIFSNHTQPVNLAGWQLDDAEGGNKPYQIPEGTIIKPDQYLAFYKTETKISLNNSNDAIRLLAPDGTLVDYTDYEETEEGVSFVLDEEFNWQPSQTPTPGEINVLQQPPEAESTTASTSTPKVLGAQLNQEDLLTEPPKNKNKYIFAGISAVVVLGLGTVLKLKKKN